MSARLPTDSRSVLLLAITLCLIGGGLQAQDVSTVIERNAAPIDFVTDIKPILREHCFACHGSLKQEAGLRLDTVSSMQAAEVLVPGQAIKSELIRRVTSEDATTRMPPEGTPLTGSQIAAIEQWILQGALAPHKDSPEEDPNKHWSFQPLIRPEVPCAVGAECDHPIDAFLHARMHQEGIAPRPLASREIWLRRVSIDLTGLPPTPEEIRSFLEDESIDAYERVVSRLLDSPRYGERWGRHWMDVWRYADWFGRRHVPDVWNSAPQVWRWRDWMVRSLNRDLGYDRMIQAMLAADELHPEDPDSLVATGYLVRNWYALNPNDWMRNVVEHSSKAFLGLTVQCAHCHDHKYDPIRQEDYFSLRAFFEPMYIRQDRSAGEAEPGPFQDYEYSTLRKIQRLGYVSVFDHKSDAATWLYTGGDERNRVSDRGSISASVPSFLQAAWGRTIEPVELPISRWYPGLHPDVQSSVRADLDRELQIAKQELEQAREQRNRWETAPELSDQRSQAIARASEAKRTLDTHLESLSVTHGPNGSGMRGLILDARAGRRMIFRSFPSLAPLQHGTRISFVVAPITSAHLNVQLTKDSAKGLTAAFIGFENGKIKSYRPGTFEEFEVAALDLESIRQQGPLEISIGIDREKDLGNLTIRHVNHAAGLVTDIPIALNGWDPANHPEQGILIDARSGAWGWFDDCIIRSSGGDELFRCDFDVGSPSGPTALPIGADIVGWEGWEAASSYCQVGGVSIIGDGVPDSQSAGLRESWEQTDRFANRWQLGVDAAYAKIAWLENRSADWTARTRAEKARYGIDTNHTPEHLSELARAAHRTGAQVQRSSIEFRRATCRWELAQIEALAPDAPDREKKLTTARAAMKQAEDAWQLNASQSLDPSRDSYEPLSRQYPRTSTGRRAALAAWITDHRHPLTARVAVNHIWMRHFHQPLVKTVFDFGRNGERPTHPELLDWLAMELMESGWSMKHLHRLIVTSQAYRRVTSAGDHSATARDPENRWLWRMNAGRMEAEVLRDSVLSIAGCLDETHGGQELENEQSLQSHRRSIYYSCYPEEGGKSPLGAIFDGPDPNDCYRRTRTILPQQSLALTNRDWVHRMSQEILKQINAPKFSSDVVGNQALVAAVFVRILGRESREEELRICVAYLEHAEGDARASLVRALINHNDFVTIR